MQSLLEELQKDDVEVETPFAGMQGLWKVLVLSGAIFFVFAVALFFFYSGGNDVDEDLGLDNSANGYSHTRATWHLDKSGKRFSNRNCRLESQILSEFSTSWKYDLSTEIFREKFCQDAGLLCSHDDGEEREWETKNGTRTMENQEWHSRLAGLLNGGNRSSEVIVIRGGDSDEEQYAEQQAILNHIDHEDDEAEMQ